MHVQLCVLYIHVFFIYMYMYLNNNIDSTELAEMKLLSTFSLLASRLATYSSKAKGSYHTLCAAVLINLHHLVHV